MRRGAFLLQTGFAVVTIAFAFALGFAWDSLSNPRELAAEFSTLPARLSMAAGVKPPKGSLPTIPTYSDVLDEIQRRHYQKVDPTEITYAAISGMMGALEDPYTRFMTPKAWKAMEADTRGDYVGVGATLEPSPLGAVVKRPLPDSPCIRAGVKAGDLIYAVDNRNVAGMAIDDIVRMIKGEEKTKVTLSIERKAPNGQPQQLQFTLVRATVGLPTVEYRVVKGATPIGYIYLYQFNEKAGDSVEEAVRALRKQHVQGLVLDLRDDPGGLLTQAIAVAGKFLKEKSVVIVRDRSGQEETLYTRPSDYMGTPLPMAVLINDRSASASEIVSGCLKDHHAATLVGEKSFGKGLVQTLIDLRDGSAVAITTARYFTPNHTDINHRRNADGELVGGGLQPDYAVDQNPDWIFGNDETDSQLKKAVQVLTAQIKK